MAIYMVKIHITFPCIKMYYRPHNIYKINHGCCKPEKVTSTHNSSNSTWPLCVCLTFSSRYTVCLACFSVPRWYRRPQIVEFCPHFSYCPCLPRQSCWKCFYCSGQCTQLGVSSRLRVVWVVLQKRDIAHSSLLWASHFWPHCSLSTSPFPHPRLSFCVFFLFFHSVSSPSLLPTIVLSSGE